MILMWIFFLVGHWLGFNDVVWWSTPFILTGAVFSISELTLEIVWVVKWVDKLATLSK